MFHNLSILAGKVTFTKLTGDADSDDDVRERGILADELDKLETVDDGSWL